MRYDRVYVWNGFGWQGKTVPDYASAKRQNEQAKAIRDKFVGKGYSAVLGSSTVGPPEGEPTI